VTSAPDALASLRRGLATWQRLGLRRGTRAAVSLAFRPARAYARSAWLRWRPLRVSADELRAALGEQAPRRLLGEVLLGAMPTVAAFRDQLVVDQRLQAHVLESAEQIAAHRFDLLGSGPTELGRSIDWQRDFKSGRTWPLSHISRIVVNYPDGSDIKVPWELSRFQHLPVLAGAFRVTLERRWIDEIGAQLRHWIESNPVEFGANWACTMDVAIRAANWIATLALLADEAPDEAWFTPVLGSLLLHARFIRRHLEWAPLRGNHYLSDVVGLLVVSALFSAGREGQSWARFAAREVAGEFDHQVRPDGCDHEASIPYHRLVAELFICGVQAADAIVPGAIRDDHRRRLEAMLRFTADYTRPDGCAPQVGDADNGRFLPLGDYGADPRSHRHLFEQARCPYRSATRSAAYPEGGYWIMRVRDIYVLVRCGDVGVGGLGSHAHNDALSFELTYRNQPLIVDPGSYVYTADPTARNLFRSSGFHSTLQVDRAEQNPIWADSLFAMEDRRRAEAVRWDPDATRPSFVGRHHGYESLPHPATHTRRIELDSSEQRLLITDTVASSVGHELGWTFPLGPCEAEASGPRAVARFPSGIRLEVEASGVDLWIAEGWVSPGYGTRDPVPFLRGRKHSRAGRDVTDLILTPL
jgi:heparinase II/III-like protein